MNFSSDNWAGAHPRIAEHLARSGGGFDPAYGAGAIDRRVAERFNEIFEREVSVFFVGTGTAANSLALTLYDRPGGIAFCHREAHVIEDECGAPEYFTGGSRLHAVDGALGRMDLAELEAAVAKFAPLVVHSGRPTTVTVTQSTEAGTVYDLATLDAIAAIARGNGLALHMDGARFANALVSLDATPAEMTWKRGVDILSFGGTKNGCWCAEAIVLFDIDKARDMGFVRKRAAQLFSKSRFIAAQFEAYFEGGLWLENARHSNAMARRLADAFRSSAHASLAWEPQANEVFAVMRKSTAEQALAAGANFYEWNLPHDFDRELDAADAIYRFVTSFETTADAVDGFAAVIG